MYFSAKYLRTYLQKLPQNPILGDLSMRNRVTESLRQSHVNGATMLKLYGHIGIGKYLGCGKIFPLGRLWGRRAL